MAPLQSHEPADYSRPVGHYAGRARFAPRFEADLPPQLAAAVGKIVHVEMAGRMPPDKPCAGQELFRECPGGAVLGRVWVPEQDLEFLD